MVSDKIRKLIMVGLIITAIFSNTILVNEIQLTQQLNYRELISSRREETVNYLIDNFWDQESHGFYTYRLENGSFTDKGIRKYTSFNAWTIRALLEYVVSYNYSSVLTDYTIETLNFLISHAQDTSNKGFYHWVYENGSSPAMGNNEFNNSVYQVATYQAWMILALIETSQYTSNNTYIERWGKELANFLITKLWDAENGGFYSVYLPFYDRLIETKKYTWYQVWPAVALMNLYEITGNQTYMNYVNLTLDFLISHLWNTTLKGFVYNCLENGTFDPLTEFSLVDQGAIILTFSKAAELTGNQTYWNEFAIPALNFTKYFLWNDEFKQFYLNCNLNGINVDPQIRPSDLSIWLFSLFTAVQILQDGSLRSLLDAAAIQMVLNGWDSKSGGFLRKYFINGTLLDEDKWSIEQSIPLYFLIHFNYTAASAPNSSFYYSSLFLFVSISLISLLHCWQNLAIPTFERKKIIPSKRKKINRLKLSIAFL